MPNWQAELEQLLASLNVNIDRGMATHSMRHSPLINSGSSAFDDFDPSLVPDPAIGREDAAPDGDEVAAVRNEIEATVRRVVAMTESGLLEASVRDDVLFVLQALTRPQPHHRRRQLSPADSSGEWQLTSAAAVLHFCRIVLRLTQAIESQER